MPVDPQPVQAGLFVLLLLAASVCDLRSREIPDWLQLAIAATALLCFSPQNLLGILGALPYLVMALLFNGMDGMGGGDIKLVAATGIVLGLPASLSMSIIGLVSFTIYATVHTVIRQHHGKVETIGFPVGPFLACGAVVAYFMKMGGMIL